MTIYEIGPGGYWTEQTQEIDENEGAPRGWTRATPPDLAEGEYAVWAGQWVITTEPYTAPETPSTSRISRKEFISRLTPDEFAAIEDSTDVQVRYFRELLRVAEFVDLEDPLTENGIRYIEGLGLIGTGRADDVLGITDMISG